MADRFALTIRKSCFPGLTRASQSRWIGPFSCPSPMKAAASDEAVMRESLALLERYNIWAVTSGSLDRVSVWRASSPRRIIPAISFATSRPGPRTARLSSGGCSAMASSSVFAEIGAQYQGLRLDDKSYDPFFALAEELDIPVGVHLGEGPPGGAHVLGGPTESARIALGLPVPSGRGDFDSPSRLRLYVMHYGSPLVDEMIALLFSHPQVYVDIAQNDWGFPRAHFYSQLKRLIDAGFEKRIMWGSDQMVWPRTIEVAIKTIEDAPFLSREQKRDIFYNNAARFLRLSKEEIAKHHGRRTDTRHTGPDKRWQRTQNKPASRRQQAHR